MGYAFKKDSKGERHGTPAERLLAEQKNAADLSTHRPNTLFATGASLQHKKFCKPNARLITCVPCRPQAASAGGPRHRRVCGQRRGGSRGAAPATAAGRIRQLFAAILTACGLGPACLLHGVGFMRRSSYFGYS